MREFRTSGSVGAPGEQSPGATRSSSRLNTRADILESHERSMGLRVGDTFNQRSADGLVRLAETLLATGVRASSSAERYQVVVHVDAATLERRHTTDPSQCTLEDGPWLATETARRITCDASLVKLTEDSKGTPSTSAARPAASPHRCAEPSKPGTRAAASPAAPKPDSSTVTTSTTGPPAARPTSTTWCNCAVTTTVWCTKADSTSPDAPTTRCASPGRTARPSSQCRAPTPREVPRRSSCN